MTAARSAQEVPGLPSSAAALAERHLPLVAAMVRRIPHPPEAAEDLFQQGCLGLMKAAARFDPQRGAAFSTYAVPLILGEMRQWRRETLPVHRTRREQTLHTRLQAAQDRLTAALGREPTIPELSDDLDVPPEELAAALPDVTVSSYDAGEGALLDCIPDQDPWEDRLLLRDLVNRLCERDRRLLLLRWRFGLTQRECAARLGMTQVQVSRAEAMIRAHLAAQWYDSGP